MRRVHAFQVVAYRFGGVLYKGLCGQGIFLKEGIELSDGDLIDHFVGFAGHLGVVLDLFGNDRLFPGYDFGRDGIGVDGYGFMAAICMAMSLPASRTAGVFLDSPTSTPMR